MSAFAFTPPDCKGTVGTTIVWPEASATALPTSSSLLYKTTVDPGLAPVTVTGVWVFAFSNSRVVTVGAGRCFTGTVTSFEVLSLYVMVTTPDAETEYSLKSFELTICGLEARNASQILFFSTSARLLVSLT